MAGTEADAVAGTEADAAAGTEADAVAGTEADAVAGTEADAAAGTEADAVAGTEADAVAGTEADAVAGRRQTQWPDGGRGDVSQSENRVRQGGGGLRPPLVTLQFHRPPSRAVEHRQESTPAPNTGRSPFPVYSAVIRPPTRREHPPGNGSHPAGDDSLPTPTLTLTRWSTVTAALRRLVHRRL